jgi:GTP-binding protein
VVNKWDVAEKKGLKPEDYAEYITQQLRGLEYAPVAFVSAKDGRGLTDLLAMAFNLHEQATHRETTGKLNSTIEEIMQQRGPSSKGGARAKVLYVSQVAVNPPTIVCVVNKPKLFHGNYERYLLNELRERLPFSEVPIRLFFRERERKPLQEILQRKARGRALARQEAPPKSRRAERAKKKGKKAGRR